MWYVYANVRGSARRNASCFVLFLNVPGLVVYSDICVFNCMTPGARAYLGWKVCVQVEGGGHACYEKYACHAGRWAQTRVPFV